MPTVSMLSVIFLSSKRPRPAGDHRRAATSVQSDARFFHL